VHKCHYGQWLSQPAEKLVYDTSLTVMRSILGKFEIYEQVFYGQTFVFTCLMSQIYNS